MQVQRFSHGKDYPSNHSVSRMKVLQINPLLTVVALLLKNCVRKYQKPMTGNPRIWSIDPRDSLWTLLFDTATHNAVYPLIESKVFKRMTRNT